MSLAEALSRIVPLDDAAMREATERQGQLTKPVGALGVLEDPDAEMATWAAMVVPVLTGAGTRGKIAHAFSRKCPVVSTPLGAYGYDPTDGRDMLLGASVQGFANACVRVIRNPGDAAEMAERAWQRYLTKWTWEAVRPHVWAAAEQCIRSTAGSDPIGGMHAAERVQPIGAP